MKILVDASIIIAALTRSAITREVLLYPYIDYYTPEFFMEELENHEADIRKKAGPAYLSAISLIARKVRIIPYHDYEPWLDRAETIIGKIDRDDIPYIAAALRISADGLWSYDEHFTKQAAVKIVSIKELVSLIRKGI
jgi:predicted nucleic acid-binding protein